VQRGKFIQKSKRVQKANQVLYQINKKLEGKKEINSNTKMRIYKMFISQHYSMAQKVG
jgi:hypothetical protein